MVAATVNSHQYSSTEASEKEEIMIINVSDPLRNGEKYKQAFRLSFCQGEMKNSSSTSLCMCKYIHRAFKITSAYAVCVAAQLLLE